MINIESAARTHKGKVRDINEDAYLASGNIFAVADGMGGHQAGEVASALALSTVVEYIEENLERWEPAELIYRAFSLANSRIHEKASAEAQYRTMGTTLTLALVIGETAYLGHVGDTRAYILRKGSFKRITSDHSLVAKMVEDGEITEQEARGHPQRNIILRALGTDPEVEVDITAVELYPDDLLLICSDGISGALTDGEIGTALSQESSPGGAAERLESLAMAAGGLDNITTVIIHAIPEPVRAPTPTQPIPSITDLVVPAEAAPIEPEPAPYTPPQKTRRWYRRKLLLIPLVIIVMLAATFGIWYALYKNSYYVGANRSEAVIYQGFPFSIFGRRAARVVLRSGVKLEFLPESWVTKVQDDLDAEGYEDAVDTIERLKEIALENTVFVPGLKGLPIEVAREELKKEELDIGKIRERGSPGVAPSTVLEQDPGPGDKVKKGAEVDLWVSPPPAP